MDADKLADFGTIKNAHGDVETAFTIYFSPRNIFLYPENELMK